MRFCATSLSHKTARIELRERVAAGLGDGKVDVASRSLQEHGAVNEVCILSTCNRVELYVAGNAEPGQLAENVRTFMSDRCGLSPAEFSEHFKQHLGAEGLRHLFRVASSLDSMVLGEPQILGQVKEAYRQSSELGTVGPVLNPLFQKAFSVAKRVRSETGVGDGAVSMSFAAVELGRSIFGSLTDKKVLLIGAGKMSALAAGHLRDHGASEIKVANRSPDRAASLAAEVGGAPASLGELKMLLAEADIVISSTAAPRYVVDKKVMKKVVRARRYRPILFVDLAVPRDIDPDLTDLENVFVYDVDDLEDVLAERRLARSAEADVAERMVLEEVDGFIRWSRSQQVKPLIVELRKKLLSIADAEAQRTLHNLKTTDPKVEASIKKMGQGIVNKALHPVLTRLKQEGAAGDPAVLVDTVKLLFEIDPVQPEAPPAPEPEEVGGKVVQIDARRGGG